MEFPNTLMKTATTIIILKTVLFILLQNMFGLLPINGHDMNKGAVQIIFIKKSCKMCSHAGPEFINKSLIQPQENIIHSNMFWSSYRSSSGIHPHIWCHTEPNVHFKKINIFSCISTKDPLSEFGMSHFLQYHTVLLLLYFVNVRLPQHSDSVSIEDS